MQEFFDFVLRHPYLWLLFLGLLSLLAWHQLRTQVGGVRKIDPKQLVDLINNKDAVVLDIRDNAAFAEGHILAAQNAPLKDFANKQIPKKLQKYKNKPVAVVCGNGQQSLKLAMQLREQGFSEPYILQGGLSAWRAAGLPITKK